MADDPWLALRAATAARIGLGRRGDALPLRAVLEFQLAHARARDAVHTPLDVLAIVQELDAVAVRSAAPDRVTYLRRPDLGRRLDPACTLTAGEWDLVFVVADGLSPLAVARHAVPLVRACLPRLEGWAVAPVVVATQARVALGDVIAEQLGARMVAVLIGERPGLSAADSLGVYLTFDPRVGRQDSERNCISNIHGAGLGIEPAADMLVWLMIEARRRKLTGVGLKDDRLLPGSCAIGLPGDL